MAEFSVDVVVIGGGIVGLSTALELQHRGKLVAVIDPGVPKAQASFGNAGVLSRGSIFPVAGPGVLGKLPRYAMGRDIAVRVRPLAFAEFPSWLPRFLRAAGESAWRRSAAALNPLVAACYDRHITLAERVGAQSLIKRNGYIRLYRDAGGLAASALERSVLAEHGVKVEQLGERELRELEPHLAPRFKAALWFTESGSVESPGELVAAYRAAMSARGGVLLQGSAESLSETDRGVTVRTVSDSVSAATVVLSAGAWSARFASKLGYRIPLAAERGYHVHLKPSGNAVLSRPVFDAVGAYVLSPMGDSIRVLSGVELARPDDKPEFRQIETVVADARRSLPFEPARHEDIWMGSRPSTPDGLPVIGFAGRHRRLLFAFGHGHIGFATGPITGRLAAQLIGGEPTSVPVDAYTPARFKA